VISETTWRPGWAASDSERVSGDVGKKPVPAPSQYRRATTIDRDLNPHYLEAARDKDLGMERAFHYWDQPTGMSSPLQYLDKYNSGHNQCDVTSVLCSVQPLCLTTHRANIRALGNDHVPDAIFAQHWRDDINQEETLHAPGPRRIHDAQLVHQDLPSGQRVNTTEETLRELFHLEITDKEMGRLHSCGVKNVQPRNRVWPCRDISGSMAHQTRALGE
jgi:hypothetical protein